MEFNGLLDEFQDLVASFRNCHTARQIRNMCAKTGFALFNDDRVFHMVILFQTGLFENTVQRARWYVNVWFASNGHGSAFRLMFELAVAAFGASQVPAIIFEQPNEVSHFHARIISALSDRWKQNVLIGTNSVHPSVLILHPSSSRFRRTGLQRVGRA